MTILDKFRFDRWSTSTPAPWSSWSSTRTAATSPPSYGTDATPPWPAAWPTPRSAPPSPRPAGTTTSAKPTWTRPSRPGNSTGPPSARSSWRSGPGSTRWTGTGEPFCSRPGPATYGWSYRWTRCWARWAWPRRPARCGPRWSRTPSAETWTPPRCGPAPAATWGSTCRARCSPSATATAPGGCLRGRAPAAARAGRDRQPVGRREGGRRGVPAAWARQRVPRSG